MAIIDSIIDAIVSFLRKLFGLGEEDVDNNEKNDKQDKKGSLFYKKKYYFFSIPEKKFFDNLQKILNGKYIIFSKVRIIDLLDIPKGMNNPSFYQHFNKIKAKHVDFVICDKEKITPLLVVELDGSSHARPDRIERDKFVDEAFNSARLPIIHFQNSDIEDKDKIFLELQNRLVPSNA